MAAVNYMRRYLLSDVFQSSRAILYSPSRCSKLHTSQMSTTRLFNSLVNRSFNFVSGEIGFVIKPSGCFCSVLWKRMKTKKAKKSQTTSSSLSKIDASIADGIIDLKDLQLDMSSCIEKLRADFKQKFAAKITPGTLDNIRVSVGGKTTALYEVAQVLSNGKEFTITPMVESENVQKQLITSIHYTGLHLNPRLDGSVIKIPISSTSSEYKQNLMKLAKAATEKSKVALRKMRQQGLSDLKKEKDHISKDDARLIEKQIQLLTDAHVQELDKLMAAKESELNR